MVEVHSFETTATVCMHACIRTGRINKSSVKIIGRIIAISLIIPLTLHMWNMLPTFHDKKYILSAP